MREAMVPIPMDSAGWDDLREHDREVLAFLSRDPSAQVAFQGIRRQLGIHPEQLSRALHRLAQDELVEKTEIGYRVTPKALAILSPEEWSTERPGTTVLHTYLPADVDLRDLVDSLRGTWIGPLRWYGVSETRDELRLTWTLEDGSIQVDVRVHGGELSIVARVQSAERLDDATRLGHLLFRQVAGQTLPSREPYGGLVA